MFKLIICIFSLSILTAEHCAFCDPAVIEYQTFYEDELVRALYTHKPVMQGHCLIIPTRHVERLEDLTEAEMAQMMAVTKKVHAAASAVFGTSAYLLHQKNGVEVGQTVPHVHIHYLPRKKGEKSEWKFILYLARSRFCSPIKSDQMRNTVEKLAEAIKQT